MTLLDALLPRTITPRNARLVDRGMNKKDDSGRVYLYKNLTPDERREYHARKKRERERAARNANQT